MCILQKCECSSAAANICHEFLTANSASVDDNPNRNHFCRICLVSQECSRRTQKEPVFDRSHGINSAPRFWKLIRQLFTDPNMCATCAQRAKMRLAGCKYGEKLLKRNLRRELSSYAHTLHLKRVKPKFSLLWLLIC